MPRRLFLTTLIILFLFVFSPKNSFAENKCGVNVGPYYDQAGAVKTMTKEGGWIVALGTNGSCSGMEGLFGQGLNVVIRGYNHHGEFTEDQAVAWVATLGKMDTKGQVVYFMPWNEPNHENEGGGPAFGPKSYEYSIKLKQLLDDAGLLNTKVILLSPMVDKLNPSFVDGSFFSGVGKDTYYSSFSGSSINEYDQTTGGLYTPCTAIPEQNNCKYREIGIPAPYYSLETGVSGTSGEPQPRYDDGELKTMLDRSWQEWGSDGNFKMFAIFSYDPHRVGAWNIYSASQVNSFYSSVCGGGSVAMGSFDQAKFDAWFNAHSSQLKNCNGNSCGWAPSARDDLCQLPGTGESACIPREVVIPASPLKCGINYVTRDVVFLQRDWTPAKKAQVAEDMDLAKSLGVKIIKMFIQYEDFAPYVDGGDFSGPFGEFLSILESKDLQVIPGLLDGSTVCGWESKKDAYIRNITKYIEVGKKSKALYAWNIRNEPGFERTPPCFSETVAEMKWLSAEVRKLDPARQQTIGMKQSNYPASVLGELLNLVDFVEEHEYWDSSITIDSITNAKQRAGSKRFYIGEIGKPSRNATGESQEDYYRAVLTFLKESPDINQGYVFPWKLIDDKNGGEETCPGPSCTEAFFGLFQKDKTLKPAGQLFKDYCLGTPEKRLVGCTTGTCEEPLKFYSKPSCETLAVKSPMQRISFTVVPGSDQELDDPGNPLPGARIWKRTFKVRFEKDWTKDNSVYKLDPSHSEYYLFDNDPNKFVIRHFTGVPASGNEKFVTAVTQGNSNNNKWGLFNYLLSPSFTTNYINGQFRDLAKKETGFLDRASAVMLSKGNIKLVGGDTGGVSVVPQTQTQLGGARLEKKELALNFFATQKVACSIMGKPGDTYCDFRSGINDFDLFASSIAQDFGTYAGDQLAVAIPGLGGDLSCGAGNTTTPKLLASSIPAGTLKVSNDSTIQNSYGTGSLGQDSPANTLQSQEGQVLGVFDNVPACYTLKTTSEKLECPYPGKAFPNKDKLDIKGKSIKEMNCPETNTGVIGTPGAGYPGSPGCTADAEIRIQHDTVYGFESPSMDLSESLVKSLTFGPTTNSRMAYQTELAGVGERDHNEVRVSSDILVKSSDKAYVVKGTTLSCEYQFLTASINNSPAHPYPQPDSKCFLKEQPPPPDLGGSCGKWGTWTNANTTDESDGSVFDPSFGVTDTVYVVGLIASHDPKETDLPGSPCTPFNYANKGPAVTLTVTYNGQTKNLTWVGNNLSARTILNLKVPRGSTYSFRSHGDAAYTGTSSELQSADTGKCIQGFVYPVVHGKSDIETMCGREYQCTEQERKCDYLDEFGVVDSNHCSGDIYSECHCDPSDPSCDGLVGRPNSGHYWACFYGDPIGYHGCSWTPSNLPKPTL